MKKRTTKRNSHHTPLANSAQVICSRCQKPILGSSSPFSSKKPKKMNADFVMLKDYKKKERKPVN